MSKKSQTACIMNVDVRGLFDSIEQANTFSTNKLGGPKTAAQRKAQKAKSFSFIEYNYREVDESLPPIHIMLPRLSMNKRESVSKERQDRQIVELAFRMGYDVTNASRMGVDIFEADRKGIKLPDEVDPTRIDRDNPAIIVRDEDGSASKNKVRPVFDNLLNFIQSFDRANPIHFWIYEWSRLTRREDVAQGVLKLFVERKVNLHIVTMPWIDLLNNENSRQELYYTIKAAETESKNTSRRAKDAHADRAKSCYFRGGPIPLGFSRVIKQGEIHPTLVVNEDIRLDYPNPISEAELVRQIFARIIKGDATNAVARWLNESGYPTQRGANGWDNRVLQGIVRNARYAGFQTHKEGKQVWSKFNNDHIVKDRDGKPLVAFEQLISSEDFYAAVAQMDARCYHRPKKYNTCRLAGIIICDGCDRKMNFSYTSKRRNGLRYGVYRCTHKAKALCTSFNTIPDNVEDVVYNLMLGYLADPTKVGKVVKLVEQPIQENPKRRMLIDKIEKKRAELETADEYDSTGIKSTIKHLEDDLARLTAAESVRSDSARAILVSPEAFKQMWADPKGRIPLNLAINAVIKEIRIIQRGESDKVLNRFELAKLGWAVNMNRVVITLQSGEVLDLPGLAPYATPVEAA